MKTVFRVKHAVAIFVLAGVMSPYVQAQGLNADEYVVSLTQHLQNNGELGNQEIQNVLSIASSASGSVDQESFIRLGNALYRAGHAELGNKVMASNIVVPERYMGATSRINMARETTSQSDKSLASSRESVDALYDQIFQNHGVDRSAAEWYANAVESGDMTLSQVEGQLQQVYNTRFGTPGQRGPSGATPQGVSPSPTSAPSPQPTEQVEQSKPAIDQVYGLYDVIFEGHGVDRSAARWYANAIESGDMTLAQVRAELWQVYNTRFNAR